MSPLPASTDDTSQTLTSEELNDLYEERACLMAIGVDLQPKVPQKGFTQCTHGQILTARESLAAAKQASDEYYARQFETNNTDTERERKKAETMEKKAL